MSGLSRDQVRTICRKVYHRFPELDGVRPQVSCHGREDEGRFLLRFDTSVSLADGRSLPTRVRVVVNSRGKIIKMTSTR